MYTFLQGGLDGLLFFNKLAYYVTMQLYIDSTPLFVAQIIRKNSFILFIMYCFSLSGMINIINKILNLIAELSDSETVTEVRLTSADRAQHIFDLLITQLYNWHRS